MAPNVVPVQADWTAPEEWWAAVVDAVGDAPVALAVTWMHSTAGGLHERVRTLVPEEGLLVRVRGHAVAEPHDGELAAWIDRPHTRLTLPEANERHVVLGWHAENGGEWLASDEIGTGVVAHVSTWLADTTALPVAWVGSVRPWGSRPPG